MECTESYSASKPGEEWIQCITCKLWAHSKCAKGNSLFYECKNCNSDLEDWYNGLILDRSVLKLDDMRQVVFIIRFSFRKEVFYFNSL